MYSAIFSEKLFRKSVPESTKLTVKGGAAVDPDSGTVTCNPCTVKRLGDIVSMLTHTYPPRSPWNIKMAICHHEADCLTYRLSDLVIYKHRIEPGHT